MNTKQVQCCRASRADETGCVRGGGAVSWVFGGSGLGSDRSEQRTEEDSLFKFSVLEIVCMV